MTRRNHRSIAYRLCLPLALAILTVPRLLAQMPPPAPPAPAAEADWLTLGQAAEAAKDYPAAIADYQQAGALAPQDVVPVAALAKAESEAGRFTDAVALLQASQSAFSLPTDQKTLQLALSDVQFAWGESLLQNSPAAAIPHYQAAADIDKPLRLSQAGVDLRNMGLAYDRLGQYQRAIDSYQQALTIHRQTGDKSEAARELMDLGNAYLNLSQPAKAIGFFQQALTINHQVGDREREAGNLGNLGLAYDDLSQPAKAIGFYQQALPLFRQAGDRRGEAGNLGNLGNAYLDMSQYDKALDFYQQALIIHRQTGDKNGAARDLMDLGLAYDDLSQPAKAIGFYQQALPLFRQAGDRRGEADDLGNLGNAYLDMSQYQKTIASFQQALIIHRQTGDKNGAANDLGNLGNACSDLSQYDKALDFYQQALTIHRQTGDKDDEARDLMELGVASYSLRQSAKAIGFYQQALLLFRQTGDKDDEANDLLDLGQAWSALNQSAKAIGFYQRALPLFLQTRDRDGEARDLNNLGDIYDHLSQYRRAIDFRHQALTIFRQIGDREGESSDLNSLMLVWKAQKQPRLAVFYGKQAVNTYQSIRRAIQGLDKNIQTGYVHSKSGTYRTLADLLISQDRLPEAQQVLKMLKEREFYDFLQGSQGDPTPQPQTADFDTADLTPREARWAKAYDQIAAPLAALGQEQQSLQANRIPTPQQRLRLGALAPMVQSAEAGLSRVLRATAADFAGSPTAADTPPRVTAAQELARSLKPGTVALYTIVAPDKLYTIVVTPTIGGKRGRTVAHASPIKSGDLYQLVYRLRQALTDPRLDPRPLAGSLYALILGPVQKTLDDAHATTLLLSLDDALRYVPPTALYNLKTRRYVAQDYRTELITLAGSPAAAVGPPTVLSVLGGGVSAGADGDAPLPGVRQELEGIVHQDGDTGGLIPGTRLLNAAFLGPALEADLKTGHYALVHLASHFMLHPTDADSYLLLGDGSHLSVADLKADPQRFRGVDLLTLSACETAMEVKSSTGREVEGLGALAQRLGARRVLASLWPVSDAVTPRLMTTFYGYRKKHPRDSVAEALRQAQLSLLAGAAAPSSGLVRGTARDDSPRDAQAPSFVAPKGAPYAHPFYWAPFVLIGNWR